ncbi:MAG: ferritin-like domain-containing protein [Deltaproteobacteria bacterium]|nr:ferritin-like domain-containing protein [Deltaproteobacteria bacterium]
MRTRELLKLDNTGHPGIASIFSKAHSADWDIDRDVDWSTPVGRDESIVDHEWTAFGRTPTFRALPDEVKSHVNRRGAGRILNILQVGESVAQDVCAKLALTLRAEDHRNAAVAQAMDEARHHLAYRRFIDKMDEELEDIDPMTEGMFDELLATDDPLRMIATEQFFLESMAMSIFEGLHRHATNPLLKDILGLITRDESRHMGFGVLYVAAWMKEASLDERIGFTQRWLGQILFSVTDRPGPLMLQRVLRRIREAGYTDTDSIAPAMLREQEEINRADQEALLSGRATPQLLKSARNVGMLAPDILEALGASGHPVLRAALRMEEAPVLS